MKNWLKFLVIIFVIVIYILSINLFASLINFSSQSQSLSSMFGSSSEVIIGFSESVSVTVTRERFYGTIIINNGMEYLYLFNLITLPKKINGYGFMIFHIIFLIILILLTILLFIKKKVYKEENPNLEHENLAENHPYNS